MNVRTGGLLTLLLVYVAALLAVPAPGQAYSPRSVAAALQALNAGDAEFSRLRERELLAMAQGSAADRQQVISALIANLKIGLAPPSPDEPPRWRYTIRSAQVLGELRARQR